MRKLLITSTRTSAGKTTVGAGLIRNLEEKKNVGFFKPFADRIIQRDKRVLDSDVLLFKELLDFRIPFETLSVGYDYHTLLSDVTIENLHELLKERFTEITGHRDSIIVESARNFSYGSFIGLDSYTLCRELGLEMVLVADGDAGLIVDKCIVVMEHLRSRDIPFHGVIINKMPQHLEGEIKEFAVPALEKRSIPVLGLIPEEKKLSTYSVGFVANRIGAKVLAGHNGISRKINSTLVGAMTAESAVRKGPIFEADTFIITGGDRIDMILLALEMNSAGVLLTGNLVPHPRILVKADDLNIPILSVLMDTFTAAKQVEQVIALLLPDEPEKIEAAETIVKKYVDVERLAKILGAAS